MLFSVITKNLNWEILTKNCYFLKNGMELRMKIWKGGGGGLEEFANLRGALPKKGGGGFWEEVNAQLYTMQSSNHKAIKTISLSTLIKLPVFRLAWWIGTAKIKCMCHCINTIFSSKYFCFFQNSLISGNFI